MERFLRGRLLAAAMIFTSIPLCAAVPAYAQVSVDISFDSFHDQLAPYGSWVYSDRWGTVWQPGDVPDDFRPYDTGGHWEYTDEYGWTWISDYAWGDVAFHYGRWVYDTDDGWLWMPGYVWSPGWVVWRGNSDYLGWMPMPPDDNFLSGRGDIGASVSWGDPDRYYADWYGPSYGGYGSMWVFVNYGHIADRDYRRYEARRDQVPGLVRQTTNITNYTVVNNHVVNRSIDLQRVSHAAGHPIRPVAARTVLKHPNMISTVARGEQVRAQMIRTAPRGMGKPNSAPPPPQAIINKLSDHAVARGVHRGGPPQHLFTKSTLTQPGASKHFRGRPEGHGEQQPAAMQTAPAHGPNGQPGSENHANDHQQNNREHRQDRMNAGPDNGLNGPQNGAGHGPSNGTETGNGRSTDIHRGSATTRFEHGPARGMKPGPDNGPIPQSGAATGPSNGPGPDNGGPHKMYHRANGPQNTIGPDSGPANGAATAPRGHREIGPPSMVGPGPGPKPVERAHENGPPANGGGKANAENHQERRPQKEKEKEQNPPPR